MSGISDLARSFEEKSKQQASAIETSVGNAYSQHEQTLLEALQSSEKTLSAAILARESALQETLRQTEANTRAAVASSWKWLLGAFLIIALGSGGALWMTDSMVADNIATLAAQRALIAQGPVVGVEFVSNKDGRFIVLPPGKKPTMGWTFNDGRNQAIKVE